MENSQKIPWAKLSAGEPLTADDHIALAKAYAAKGTELFIPSGEMGVNYREAFPSMATAHASIAAAMLLRDKGASAPNVDD